MKKKNCLINATQSLVLVDVLTAGLIGSPYSRIIGPDNVGLYRTDTQLS